MTINRYILDSRQNSSLVSLWTEYLTVRNTRNGAAILEICQNEVICEWSNVDEDGNELDVPDVFERQKVAAWEDGLLLSETLGVSSDDSFEYTASEINDALRWIKTQGFANKQKRSLLETYLFANRQQS